MKETFVFSDLAETLMFFKAAEGIVIVPHGFFNWDTEANVIKTSALPRHPEIKSPHGELRKDPVIFELEFKRSWENIYDADLLCFVSLGKYRPLGKYRHTTLDRFLNWLERVGMIYRPDYVLPFYKKESVSLGGITFFPQQVIQTSGGQSLWAWSASTIDEQTLRHEESSTKAD